MKNIHGGINVISRKSHFFNLVFYSVLSSFRTALTNVAGIISLITELVCKATVVLNKWSSETNMYLIWFYILS